MVAFLLGDKEALDSAARKALEPFQHWKVSPRTWWDVALVRTCSDIVQRYRTPLTLLWDHKGQLHHIVVAPLGLLHRVAGLPEVVSRHKEGNLWAWSFHVGSGEPEVGDTSGILHLRLAGCLYLETTGHKGGEASRKALKQHKKHLKGSEMSETSLADHIAAWRWLLPVYHPFKASLPLSHTSQPFTPSFATSPLQLEQLGPFRKEEALLEALEGHDTQSVLQSITGLESAWENWQEMLNYASRWVYEPFQLWRKKRPPGAMVVSVHPSQHLIKQEALTTMEELAQLLDTIGYEVRGQVIQHRPKPDVRTYLGEGRAEALALEVVQFGIDRIVIDETLTPTQLRHLEALVRVPVWDRSEVILNVFESRAKTPEGKLQVALARLKYDMPRLAGRNQSLSRQTATGAGAGAATRGSGETQLELDRRQLRERIQQLEEDITELAQRRERQRTRRHEGRRNPAYVVALVGYTNAGKSTLMRRLSGDKEVYVEDKLFATLDTLSRPFYLPPEEALRYTPYDDTTDHSIHILPELPPLTEAQWQHLRPNVLVDTVGFIRKLPTQLVYAFRSTLEEAQSSDLLLHVWDASSPHAYEQFLSVQSTLESLEAHHIPTLVLCNKEDKVSADLKAEREAFLEKQGILPEQILWLSAQALEGASLTAFYHRLTLWKYRPMTAS
jgi:GTP-binding protein HflX